MSNFVVLMSDEHNPFYSSVYGHPFVKTPNMQKLAETGTLFQNAYCPSPLCLPSRASFFAGRRVHDIQTYNNCNLNIDKTPESYGSVLANNSVYSAYIGKVDVFDESRNLGFSKMMEPTDRVFPGDTNHRRNPMSVRSEGAARAKSWGIRQESNKKDSIRINAAVDWLTNVAPTLDIPWVLNVALINPHFPHFAPKEYWDLYPDGEDLPEFGPEVESANHPYAKDLRIHFQANDFAEEDIRGLRRGYLAVVTITDEYLGILMDTLEKTGQLDNTNVIYTSDHGDMLGKFGMWWKCSMYEDSVRIPMIAAGPDFKENSKVNTPVDLHDLTAGIFKSTNVNKPDYWLGTPLQDIPADDSERVIFSEYHGHGTKGSSFLIRKGPYKYIYHHNAPAQLFNLENDPNELNNLINENPEVLVDLHDELLKICDPENENERAEKFIERQVKDLEQIVKK